MDSINAMSPDPSSTPKDNASVWEDFLDIFYAPSKVFARRANGNFWIPLILVTVLIAALAYANRNIMQPVLDAELAKSAAAVMKANPQITQAMLDKSRPASIAFAQYGAVVLIPIIILVMGFVTWLGAKFVDAKLSWNAALVIVSYATVPKVAQQIVLSVQGLLMDPSKLTSRFSIEVGPARFMDPASINPLLGAILDRFDLFALWGLVLIAIGVAVIGKVPKAKAWAFGIGLWVVTLLPGLFGAYRQM
ncbi:MAG TPA: YIP1 family protein, partial [Acidimicrobiales bacterium]|nr:YIP1 family protein [Acidimicrobiales bacterium]